MPNIASIPASTSIADANGNSKITTNGIGSVLHGLIIAVANAADSLVTLSDSTDPANSNVTVVPAAVTANSTIYVEFERAQSRQSDWRIGTNTGVSVIAIVNP